jgi:geranylgeranyl pyrophosphate synthase
MRDTFSIYARELRERIDASLDSLLTNTEDNTGLIDAMRYSLLNGGKRVRPLLVYASAQAVNPLISLAELNPIAASVEALHSYSLVHDDLPAMDDDDLRRGKPTCHIAFGEANAILAGDGLQTFAFDLLANAHFCAEVRISLIKTLAQGAGHRGMVLGQAIDLASVDKHISLDALQNMHTHKTGALICAAAIMGAVAANASSLQIEAITRYARAIGLAFQVQDDILDVTGETQLLGKQQGADAIRNKPTYVSHLGLEGAQQKLCDLFDEAITALDIFDENADSLRALAKYIIERSN